MITAICVVILVVIFLTFLGRSAKKYRTKTTLQNSAQTYHPKVTPQNVVPYYLANYEHVTEAAIADASRQLSRACPLSDDIGLLYALRVSLCLPQVKNLNTLASRYNTAWSGAGGIGLLISQNSSHYQKVYDFLTKLYLKKFTEIAGQYIQKAQNDESKRKTEQAKINCWNVARERIRKSSDVFHIYHKPPEFNGIVEALETEIEDRIEKIIADSKKLGKKLTGKCDCCKIDTPQNNLVTIDSGQRLCQNCFGELRHQ